MLGDMPGVTVETAQALLAGRGDAPLAVCRYDDGRGHPFAFDRRMFEELAHLHGDKGVWRLLDQRAGEVVEIPIAGQRPARRGHPRRLRGSPGRGRVCGGTCMSRLKRSDELEEEMRRLVPNVERLGQMLGKRRLPRRRRARDVDLPRPPAARSRCCSKARPASARPSSRSRSPWCSTRRSSACSATRASTPPRRCTSGTIRKQLLSIRVADSKGTDLGEEELFGAGLPHPPPAAARRSSTPGRVRRSC